MSTGSLLSLLGLLDVIDNYELHADRACFSLLNGCAVAFALFLTVLVMVLSSLEEMNYESEPDKDWSEVFNMMEINTQQNDKPPSFIL
jgi:hypothetical protein